MIRTRLTLGVAAAAMLATIGVSADAPPAGPLTAQTLPLSPTVLATVASRPQQLELLVLWRGAPGWYLSGAQQRGASAGEHGGVFQATIAYGAVPLRLSFNPRDSTASIQGSPRSLPAGTNVLLVDEVDSSTGPRLVDMLAVPSDGPVDPRAGTLAPFLKRSPAMVAFLQCNGVTPGSRGDGDRTLRRIVCDELSAP
jgi:hypothetical protein